jgi:hypothetical protein
MDYVLKLLSADIGRVEAQFREDLNSRVPLIRKVGEYVLASGGKRVRPRTRRMPSGGMRPVSWWVIFSLPNPFL